MRLLTETTAIKRQRYSEICCQDCGMIVSEGQPECENCGCESAILDDLDNDEENYETDHFRMKGVY